MHPATTRSTVVGAIHKVGRRRVLLTTLIYHGLAVAKFSKSRVWGKVSEGSSLISSDTRRVGSVEGSLHAKNQLDSSSRFDMTPACDGQTGGHTTTANTALA